jgi:hypothetical protein
VDGHKATKVGMVLYHNIATKSVTGCCFCGFKTTGLWFCWDTWDTLIYVLFLSSHSSKGIVSYARQIDATGTGRNRSDVINWRQEQPSQILGDKEVEVDVDC